MGRGEGRQERDIHIHLITGGFKGEVVENLKRILQPQFQSTTFISDIAAIFVCYMYERYV